MKISLSLLPLALLAGCGGLPAGQADGGVTGAETEELNQAAEMLDSQKAPPAIDGVEAAETPVPDEK